MRNCKNCNHWTGNGNEEYDVHEYGTCTNGPEANKMVELDKINDLPIQVSFYYEENYYKIMKTRDDYFCEFHKEEKLAMNNYVEDTAKQVVDLIARKNKDYGNSFSKQREKHGVTSFLIRLEDKLSRYENLSKVDSKIKVTDENLEDTLKDIIGYTLLELNFMFNKET